MKNVYKISLDDYYKSNKKSYYFFDGLIRLSSELQKDIFEQIDIVQSTYRANRSKANGSSKIVKKLLNYFHCNDKNIIIQHEIEELLNDILYCIFYKVRDRVEELKAKLQTYIDYNTIIKPILVLYKVLLIAFGNIKYEAKYEETKDDIKFLAAFSNLEYFNNSIDYIFKSILYFYKKYSDVDYLEESANKYSELSWIYYNLRAMRSYYEDDANDSLYYYNRVLKIYEEAYSLERVLMVINIMAFQYNNLGNYHLALKECNKVLNYAFSINDKRQAINLSLHYIYAKYKLKKYEDVIDFYEKYFKSLKECNYTASVVILLTAHKLKKDDIINDLLQNYNNANLMAFYKYINDNDESLISNLNHTLYSSILYQELKDIINSKK